MLSWVGCFPPILRLFIVIPHDYRAADSTGEQRWRPFCFPKGKSKADSFRCVTASSHLFSGVRGYDQQALTSSLAFNLGGRVGGKIRLLPLTCAWLVLGTSMQVLLSKAASIAARPALFQDRNNHHHRSLWLHYINPPPSPALFINQRITLIIRSLLSIVYLDYSHPLSWTTLCTISCCSDTLSRSPIDVRIFFFFSKCLQFNTSMTKGTYIHVCFQGYIKASSRQDTPSRIDLNKYESFRDKLQSPLNTRHPQPCNQVSPFACFTPF
jgi:hypothetical protein